jgi:YebC/PmpR family DNA-binding regulatory protein
LSRNIFVAAKGGDANPDNNAALAAAIAKAKSYSLPKDKIDTAIAKAHASGADGATWAEVVYEGYGSDGVALYVETLTDNRNRTASDIRAAFTRAGGNLGTSGSVAFQFDCKGEITIDKDDGFDEDELMLLVADAGGEDMVIDDEGVLVVTEPSAVVAVKKALKDAGARVRGAELVMNPVNAQTVGDDTAKKVMRLIDKLEELDDVQNVYHTMDLTVSQIAALDE